LRTICTLLVGLGLLTALLVPAFAGGVEPSALAPVDLLAAVPAPTDVPGVVATPANYWPQFPQFNVGPANAEPRAGERFYLVQNFTKFDDQEQSRLEVSVLLFATGKQAHRAFMDMSSEIAQGAKALPAPHLGDESRYFVLSARPSETIMRYRVGPLTGRVTLYSRGAPASMDAVRTYGVALVGKLQDVLDGKLAAPSLPADFAAVMPPAAVATQVGPILGSAVVPVEAWALMDTSRDPVKIRDLLKAGGVTNLYYRRYAVSGLPGQVLETTAFQFNNAQAASDWVWLFIRQVAAHGPVYDPGNTGVLRAFTLVGGSNFELQFAKGRLVGDVSGMAPFGDLDPRLQPRVRQAAELWFDAVPLS
jgi:hypothetical protein